MDEARLLDNLFKADDGNPQPQGRSGKRGGDFASQFLALLFDGEDSRASSRRTEPVGVERAAVSGERESRARTGEMLAALAAAQRLVPTEEKEGEVRSSLVRGPGKSQGSLPVDRDRDSAARVQVDPHPGSHQGRRTPNGGTAVVPDSADIGSTGEGGRRVVTGSEVEEAAGDRRSGRLAIRDERGSGGSSRAGLTAETPAATTLCDGRVSSDRFERISGRTSRADAGDRSGWAERVLPSRLLNRDRLFARDGMVDGVGRHRSDSGAQRAAGVPRVDAAPELAVTSKTTSRTSVDGIERLNTEQVDPRSGKSIPAEIGRGQVDDRRAVRVGRTPIPQSAPAVRMSEDTADLSGRRAPENPPATEHRFSASSGGGVSRSEAERVLASLGKPGRRSSPSELAGGGKTQVPSLMDPPRVAAGRAEGGTGPQPSAREVGTGQIFDQIVTRMRLQQLPGTTRLTVQLQPEHLGRIEIETVFDKDGMRAVIRVEDGSVKKLVETGLQNLIQRLADAGIELRQAEVSHFAQDGRQGGTEQDQPGSRSGGESGRGAKSDSRDADQDFSSELASAQAEAEDNGNVNYFA